MRILSQNELVATGVTGKVVHDACGLPVRCLYPGARGGAEQISSMIAEKCKTPSVKPPANPEKACSVTKKLYTILAKPLCANVL